MIKALSIQVQPHRAPGLDITAIQAAFEALTQLPLVKHHTFNNGRDKVEYFNFTLGTEDLPALWREVQSRLYIEPRRGPWIFPGGLIRCAGAGSGWRSAPPPGRR